MAAPLPVPEYRAGGGALEGGTGWQATDLQVRKLEKTCPKKNVLDNPASCDLEFLNTMQTFVVSTHEERASGTKRRNR